MFRLVITGDLGFEVWQDIPGYEGLYQASTCGRIKSVERTRNIGINNKQKQIIYERLLKYRNAHGYSNVGLCKDSLQKQYRVHRLIAQTFLPTPKSELTQVNHKDENKFNNRVENLEWCTAKYNTNYGTGPVRRSKSQRNHPLKSKAVIQKDLDGNFIALYPSIIEAERITGYNNAHIAACCKHKKHHNTAYGYKWEYAEE